MSYKPLIVITILSIISIFAWLTHVIHCLMYAKYILLIAGGIIVPIGVIHGIGLWLGVSW